MSNRVRMTTVPPSHSVGTMNQPVAWLIGAVAMKTGRLGHGQSASCSRWLVTLLRCGWMTPFERPVGSAGVDHHADVVGGGVVVGFESGARPAGSVSRRWPPVA